MMKKKKTNTAYAVYVGYALNSSSKPISVHKTLTEAYVTKEELEVTGVLHSIRVGHWNAQGDFQTV